MALTESNEFTLGTIAPDFTLLNTVNDREVSLDNLKGEKGTVVLFICNHCPFVIHVNDELVKMANEFQQKGINFIAISSNDVEKYPEDAPHLMKQLAKEMNYPFPYLYDETQEKKKICCCLYSRLLCFRWRFKSCLSWTNRRFKTWKRETCFRERYSKFFIQSIRK